MPFGLFVPYNRFRDSHLLHHHDERLTDPYDDPESNYLDPDVFKGLSHWMQNVLQFNNTLLGRMLVGPIIGLWSFYKADIQAVRQGNEQVVKAYALHICALAVWLWWLHTYGTMPLSTYFLCCYAAFSILRIRTYLEHQAHADIEGRTVVIEDRGLLAFCFLNNNFHLVHHIHPRAPWFTLPSLYANNREAFLKRNHHYAYANYRKVIGRYILSRKDSVAHPHWTAPDK